MNNYNGIWFFGLSGVGKSYASSLIKAKRKNTVVIDGDVVREYLSHDLGYSIKDRNIQIKRMYGIAKIIINSNYFPVVSSVWMNLEISKLLKKEKINLIKIEADMKEIFKSHKTYKNKSNVVGKDITFNRFKHQKIINNKDRKFWMELKKLI